MESELDKNIWAIVTATNVVCINNTYSQCITIINEQGLNKNEATIVSNKAAARMILNKINHYAKI
jgi:hypothetical protein